MSRRLNVRTADKPPSLLMSRPEEVVRRFNSFWAAGHIGKAIELVAEDAVYALHLSGDLLPFAGETRGREAIKLSLEMMREQFEYILYRPHTYRVEGDRISYRVEFIYRHRKSGEALTGNFRLVAQVREGLLVRAEEYHDRAMVETFVRLFGM